MAVPVDEKWHRIHDIANILVLPLVIAVNLLYLLGGDTHAKLQFLVFLTYIVFDTIFILVKPDCVASPKVIAAHHMLVMFGWSWMLVDDTFYRWASYGLLVEINTWFHVLRRNFRSSLLIQILFFISWFTLRDVMYPVILYHFIFEYFRYSHEKNTYMNGAFVILALMAYLTWLNMKWTYELSKKFKIHNYSVVFDKQYDKGM